MTRYGTGNAAIDPHDRRNPHRIVRHCAGGKGATNSYLIGRKFLCPSNQATALAMPVTTTYLAELQQLVSLHGYWVVGLIVGLESLGLPLPGETILVLAAIYAATEPSFNIWVVIAVAAVGAISGDNVGYWLGSRYGYALLLRYGKRIGMFEPRIKLGQYLFLRHGAKVVFLGRFVALLRILAAFLAGLNRMPWRIFLMANATGGVIWAAVFGLGGFVFGKALLQLHHALAPLVFALALAGFFGCGYLIRRYENRLTALAERALPGPLVAALHAKRP
jgi:membrane protein DedA with SNARE-associated domain